MPGGTPSITRRPFTDADDRELVNFLAIHHPSKEGRMGNAVYKLLTEQPHRWPWGERHTWMSWRQRYKNNEGRFDHHIKLVQQKSGLSRRAVPVGSEAMLVDGMEDLDDFGTDEEEEDERPRGKRAARVDSDIDEEDEEPTKAQSRPVARASAAPKQPTSKRKRDSDANGRTPKRTRVTEGGDDQSEGGNSTNGLTEKEDGAMNQDSQGEETLEVEQNLFSASDEDSFATPRSHSRSNEGTAPTRPAQVLRSGGSVAPTSKNHPTIQPREQVHRPHSPKNPPSSPFSTIDLDDSDANSPVVPKRLRKRTVPKIVESAFGRNEQFSSSQIRADSSPEFELVIEKRAARKPVALGHPEAHPTGNDMSWEELRKLQRNTPEPEPPTPSTSKRGSVEPRSSPPSSHGNDRERPLPRLFTTSDAAERRMIAAREELSKVALGFRSRFPRSPLGLKSPDTRVNGETHPFDEHTHPFDETTHPFDETTHPFDETTPPLGNSQAQTQESHPFDDDSGIQSQETHPFDEPTQQPPGGVDDMQSQRRGPAPPTPGSSKRRKEPFLTASLLKSGNGSHSRSPSHPPPTPQIHRIRSGILRSPSITPHSPQNPVANEPRTANSSSKRLRVTMQTSASRSSLQSPRSPTEDPQVLSPGRGARSGGVSPETCRPRSTATQELRELLENSPRARRTISNAELRPQTHVKPPRTSETKQLVHKTRFSEPSVKREAITPGQHLRSNSMANDDPFSSPTALKLSSPHPPTDATIPNAEQESPLASLTTSQAGLNATIKSRPGHSRRESVQDKAQHVRDPEQPDSPRPLRPATTIVDGAALRKGENVVQAPLRADREGGEDAMDESQTYDIEQDLYDVTGTPMMDLSVWPPRRIPPAHRAPSHAHQRTSSSTTNLRDRERDADGHKSSLSHHPEREARPEREAQDDREQRRNSNRLSGVSFGSPVAASSPPNARRGTRGQTYDRPDRTDSNDTSFSSRTSFGSTASTVSSTVGILAGPLGLGFAPSEADAYLGIQVACEKIAKAHGFQSEAVFRVYQEVKDLRKAEEIVIGMKRAAEKDAIARIMRVREKTERRRVSERSGESSTYWDRDGGQSWTNRRSYDVGDEEEDEAEDQETGHGIIHEEDEEDPDSPLRVEHLSRRNKRASGSSTSALRHRGGYDRPKMSTITTRTRERDRVRDRESSSEYHPPTPTRANLWERLSKSGRHPEAALMGESLRASLSMPRYETTDNEL